MRTLLSILIWLCLSAVSASADAPARYASIVVDADSLEIIHARQIDGQRFPASLTKVMTLYLVFDAIDQGELRLNETLKTSANAARTPPVGLGLRTGQTLTVDQAIQAVSVRSANDAAVVLAERLAGSEAAFAERMTEKARELGMLKTTFKTANGLPHREQTTTARDMAKLAVAILNHHRRYYHYFGQTKFTWKGQTRKNTNGLLHWLQGVDGFKTGYTRASGYNLIISAQRDGRRLIAIVLGGASGKSRNLHMQDLIERSFETMGVRPVESRPPVVIRKTEPAKIQPVQASALRLRKSTDQFVTITQGAQDIKLPPHNTQRAWSIQLGAYASANKAETQLNTITANPSLKLKNTHKSITPITHQGRTLYRARLTGLSAENAHGTCRALSKHTNSCLVIAPGG